MYTNWTLVLAIIIKDCIRSAASHTTCTTSIINITDSIVFFEGHWEEVYQQVFEHFWVDFFNNLHPVWRHFGDVMAVPLFNHHQASCWGTLQLNGAALCYSDRWLIKRFQIRCTVLTHVKYFCFRRNFGFYKKSYGHLVTHYHLVVKRFLWKPFLLYHVQQLHSFWSNAA